MGGVWRHVEGIGGGGGFAGTAPLSVVVFDEGYVPLLVGGRHVGG